MANYGFVLSPEKVAWMLLLILQLHLCCCYLVSVVDVVYTAVVVSVFTNMIFSVFSFFICFLISWLLLLLYYCIRYIIVAVFVVFFLCLIFFFSMSSMRYHIVYSICRERTKRSKRQTINKEINIAVVHSTSRS